MRWCDLRVGDVLIGNSSMEGIVILIVQRVEGKTKGLYLSHRNARYCSHVEDIRRDKGEIGDHAWEVMQASKQPTFSS